MKDYDFEGYATRTNIKCADGRTIMPNAFIENDGMTVPMVWNHDHTSPEAVLGHALLQNRPDGVYAYGKFNNTSSGQTAKECVDNGDIIAMSIYANKLKQNGGNVVHGMIREVSLVLAGANPGAYIENVIHHNDSDEDEAMIFTYTNDDSDGITVAHADCKKPEEEPTQNTEKKEEAKDMAGEKTVKDVFDTLTDEQKTVVYALIGEAIKNAKNGGEDSNMKHNVFEGDDYSGDVLSHSDMEEVIRDAKRCGSLREAAVQHGMEDVAVLAHAENYGVYDPQGYLFPEDHAVNTTPDFIKRDQEWVGKVMGGVHHTPFSRIKSIHADIREDDARARGYIKGNLKKEEVFSLLKRTTQPTTIYKKQKMDRDDIVDITDFDVISWIKGEMRLMLNEELARAFLVGDGRLSSSDDKIDENCIRPIVSDSDLYTIKTSVPAKDDMSAQVKELIKSVVRARKDYKGSGNPTFFTTEEILTEMLLIEDGFGRRLYKDAGEIASAMRCSSIVTVPVMENLTGPNGGDLLGIAVNMADYTVGADKGGAVNLFDDFDIDYNQQKYLIETRCSGSLTKPYSAMEFEVATSDAG